MISDGGAALVVTTAERAAADFPHRRVYLYGMAERSAIRGDHNPDYLMRPFLAQLAERVWTSTGLSREEVDLLYVQDPTAVWILQVIEYFGFCPVGEGGPWLAEGHTRPGGGLPLNTNGGQLSEAYMWGWLHLVEAVRQPLRVPTTRAMTSRTEAMYVWLRGEILSGRLAPEQRLIPGDLAAARGVSSNVAREALSHLAGERLVSSAPQLGFTVVSVSTAAWST